MKTEKVNPLERLTYRLYYGRNARAAFKRREKQIAAADKRLGLSISAFVFSLSLLGTGFSFLFNALAEKRLLFTVTAGISALAALFYAFAVKTNRRTPIAVHYVYYGAVFATLLLCGSVKGQDVLTLYCMLMTLFPMFVLDKPGRINLIFVGFAGAFLLTAHLLDVERLQTDALSCIAACAASCFVSRYNVRSRLSDMAHKAHIEKERDTDGLTRLFTRSAAVRDIGAFLSARSGRDGECALFLIDIDNFKSVNDTLGHGCGDKLLVDISSALRSLLRRSDYVSRLGGDEFIIFLTELPSHEWVNAKAAAINAALKRTVVSGDKRVNVSASVGIAFAEGDALSYDILYRNADIAMYTAKQAGGNSFAVYSSAQSTQRREHVSLR